jgi:hypothetical protein
VLPLRQARIFTEKKQRLVARNQDNVSDWGNMSIRGLLFQWASTIKKIYLSELVKYKADLMIISLKINLFSPRYSWKIAELALINNLSLTDKFRTTSKLLYPPSWCSILIHPWEKLKGMCQWKKLSI